MDVEAETQPSAPALPLLTLLVSLLGHPLTAHPDGVGLGARIPQGNGSQAWGLSQHHKVIQRHLRVRE